MRGGIIMAVELVQIDGSKYTWNPSKEMDELALKSFNPSFKVKTKKKAREIADYIENGICQLDWGANKGILMNPTQAEIFKKWVELKQKTPEFVEVLGKERVDFAIKNGKLFDREEADITETVKDSGKQPSPAKAGKSEAELKIEVTNNGGQSSTKVETEEEIKEEQKMAAENNNEKKQQGQQEETSVWKDIQGTATEFVSSTTGKVVTGAALMTAGYFGGNFIKEKFFGDKEEDEEYMSAGDELSVQGFDEFL